MNNTRIITENPEEIGYIQAIFGMEKRTAVERFIILRDSESEVFWKYYDEYEMTQKLFPGRNPFSGT